MRCTRRNFLKGSLLAGASWLLPSTLLPAAPKKEDSWQPAYEILEKQGKLAPRIKEAYRIFEQCRLCPRQCGVNRAKGERGFCRAPVRPVIYSAPPILAKKSRW